MGDHLQAMYDTAQPIHCSPRKWPSVFQLLIKKGTELECVNIPVRITVPDGKGPKSVKQPATTLSGGVAHDHRQTQLLCHTNDGDSVFAHAQSHEWFTQQLGYLTEVIGKMETRDHILAHLQTHDSLNDLPLGPLAPENIISPSVLAAACSAQSTHTIPWQGELTTKSNSLAVH